MQFSVNAWSQLRGRGSYAELLGKAEKVGMRNRLGKGGIAFLILKLCKLLAL